MTKTKTKPERRRFEMHVPPEWFDRVSAEAAKQGLSIAAYVRLSMIEKLEKAKK